MTRPYFNLRMLYSTIPLKICTACANLLVAFPINLLRPEGISLPTFGGCRMIPNPFLCHLEVFECITEYNYLLKIYFPKHKEVAYTYVKAVLNPQSKQNLL